MVIVTDLIVRMQPYSPNLKRLILSDPDFAKALKINNHERFASLGAVVTSYSPLVPFDEVIGFYVYDYKQDKFKQDFIVNIGKKDIEFVLYTKYSNPSNNSRIKDISQFFEKYSKGRYYIESHHPKFVDLPEVIKPRALEAINLANKLKGKTIRVFSDEELKRIDRELQKLGL
jgi:hypothetical protein